MWPLFIFRLNWTQTDSDIYVVEARGKELAESKLKKLFPNCRNIDYLGTTTNKNYIKMM